MALRVNPSPIGKPRLKRPCLAKWTTFPPTPSSLKREPKWLPKFGAGSCQTPMMTTWPRSMNWRTTRFLLRVCSGTKFPTGLARQKTTATTTSITGAVAIGGGSAPEHTATRSEEHTSELQSRGHLVCRLLLEKKKYQKDIL